MIWRGNREKYKVSKGCAVHESTDEYQIPRTDPAIIYSNLRSMSEKYKKLVTDVLGEKLKEQYPSIAKCHLKLFRGDVAFSVPTTSEIISGYVVLVRDHHGRDQFTIEIGWSTKGKFPDSLGRPSGRPTAERVEFQKNEFICRLSKFWSKYDPWWGQRSPRGGQSASLTDEGEAKVLQANGLDWQNCAIKHVADAVDQIKKYGIPYLDESFASKQVSRK